MTRIITEKTYIHDKALGMRPLASTPDRQGNSGSVYTAVKSGSSELMYADSSDRLTQLTNKGTINIDRTKLVNGNREVILDSVDGKLTFSSGSHVNLKNSNTLIGYEAGANITTGLGNIILGSYPGTSNMEYMLSIGYNKGGGINILRGKMDEGNGDTTSYLDVGVETFSILSPLSGDSLFRVQDGKLTSNDTFPDVAFGGLALKSTGENGDNTLSLQGNDINNGTAGFGYEKTFGQFGAASKDAGGLFIKGIGMNGTHTQDSARGICMHAYAKVTSYKIAGINSRGAFEINTIKTDSGTLKSWEADDVIFNIRNNGSTKFLVLGNGTVYADSTYNTYDDEDDIKLVQSFSDKKSPYFKRLTELGIMSDDGLYNIQKLGMLSIGAIGQLFNMIRGLAHQLGMKEDELYDLARKY